MKAEEIASKAAALVSGERERTHGDKADNFQNIATLWNAWLAIKWKSGYPARLSATDVAKLMALLKIARMESGQHNDDDFLDSVGYLSIAGELSQPAEPFKATYTSLSDAISGTRR